MPSKSRAETLCSVQGIVLVTWEKNGEEHTENFGKVTFEAPFEELIICREN